MVKVYPNGKREQAIRTYALLDDQSNAPLARSDLFDLLNEHGEELPYSLSSCAGEIETTGRRANGYVVESMDGSTRLELPQLIECNQIPDIRDEIPTPQVASHHEHLKTSLDI